MSDQLKILLQLGSKQKALEVEIENMEQLLKQRKEELQKLSCVDIPEFMNELGITEFTFEDGSSIQIKRDLRAYVVNEDKDEVYAWLKQNNLGSIIKAKIEAAFETKQYNQAELLLQELRAKGYNASLKEDIHWATFNKFVREALEDARDLHEKIKIQHVVQAKVN